VREMSRLAQSEMGVTRTSVLAGGRGGALEPSARRESAHHASLTVARGHNASCGIRCATHPSTCCAAVVRARQTTRNGEHAPPSYLRAIGFPHGSTQAQVACGDALLHRHHGCQ